jgi:O-succinylbenzoic acid--CoA ligase
MAAALTPWASWQDRCHHPWILDTSAVAFAAMVDRRRSRLCDSPDHPRPLLLLAEPEPVAFLASFLAACLENWDVALANPSWGQQEWQQVYDQLSPHQVWGHPGSQSPHPGPPLPESNTSRILIATGGSSGQLRFAIHTWQTLTAAVQGFMTYFEQSPINTYCVLPLHHVSGLMQALRSWLSGGQIGLQPFKYLMAGQTYGIADRGWFISLVPTQLQRLLAPEADASDWLRDFQAILLGGAPPWPALLDQARTLRLPVALTYGMTETAALITALKPDAFQAGCRGNGQLLPHARVMIQSAMGQPLPPGQIGRLAIQAQSLALGYLGEPFGDWFYPDDVGYWDANGDLQIVGRCSQKIITGGENVFPAEVEAALWATQQVQDVCVLGLSDPDWGQVVTAVYVPAQDWVSSTTLKTALSGQLSAYKQPKYWLPVTALSRNAQGKLNHQAMRQQLLSRLSANAAARSAGAGAAD